MIDRSLAAAQLSRMRGMTRYYHGRFFSDVRFTTLAVIVLLLVGWWEVPEAFALVPVMALIGAVSTAFDASYLVFARQYAARLEVALDPAGTTLVAARLEDVYLFPLDSAKVVTVRFGAGFTWFGFVTLFYTVLGVIVAAVGVGLALPVLEGHGDAWLTLYVALVSLVALVTVVVGVWWFPGGAGERRLRAVLDQAFGAR